MNDSSYVQFQNEAYRVAGTRIALDSIVRRFWEGDAPESILQSFPVLTLEQIYGAIAYYLRHQSVIDAYLKQVASDETAIIDQLRHQNQALHERLRRLKKEHVESHES